jgi:hypothetical protein
VTIASPRKQPRRSAGSRSEGQRLGSCVCMGTPQRQRSIGSKVGGLSVAGLGLVVGGLFILGPVTWLGIAMIAMGIWPAMLPPIAHFSRVQKKLGFRERSTASTPPDPTADRSVMTSKMGWSRIGPRGFQLACISGALIIGIVVGIQPGSCCCVRSCSSPPCFSLP